MLIESKPNNTVDCYFDGSNRVFLGKSQGDQSHHRCTVENAHGETEKVDQGADVSGEDHYKGECTLSS